MRLFGLDSQSGAETTVFLASSPAVENVSGKYFIKKKEATPTRQSQDIAAAQRLWQVSEGLTRLR